jgi:hypothetical protein
MFTVTVNWLHAFGTFAGSGWTRQQLWYLGVRMPPGKGWLKGMEGKQITDTAKHAFEAIGLRNQAKHWSSM